jgi:hypothetical protein
MADTRQITKSVLNRANDLPNVADAPASLFRTPAVYFPDVFSSFLGPDHLAADGVAIGAGIAFVGVKAAIDIGKEVQYHKRGTAKYLDQQIDYLAQDLTLTHCSHNTLTEEDRNAYQLQVAKKLRDGLESKDLQTLADDLFGPGTYTVALESSNTQEPSSSSANESKENSSTKEEEETAEESTAAAPLLSEIPTPRKLRKIRLIKNKTPTPVPVEAPVASTEKDNLDPPKLLPRNRWENFVEKVQDTRIAKIISSTWSNFFHFALFYWIGWFTVWLFTGIEFFTSPLAIGLTFGIPLIIPAITYVWQVGTQIYKWVQGLRGKPREKTSHNSKSIEKLRRQLIATKLITDYYAERNAQLDKLMAREKITTLGKTTADVISELSQKEADRGTSRSEGSFTSKLEKLPKSARRLQSKESFWHSRSAKIGLAVLSGAMMGYIITFFMSVPVITFLMSVGAIATAATPLGIGIILGLCITVGLFFAVKAGTTASSTHKDMHNTTVDKHGELHKLKQAHVVNKYLRRKVNKNHDTLKNYGDSVAAPLVPKISEKSLDKNPHFWEALTLKPESKWNSPINIFNTACVWLFTSWTGSLFIRSLFLGTGVFTLLNPAIGLPVIAAMGIGLGLVWGTYRLADHYLKEKQKNDFEYVKQARSFNKALEAENEYLLKLDQAQTDSIRDNGKKSPATQIHPSPVSQPEKGKSYLETSHSLNNLDLPQFFPQTPAGLTAH